jgi:hypothetical protein
MLEPHHKLPVKVYYLRVWGGFYRLLLPQSPSLTQFATIVGVDKVVL